MLISVLLLIGGISALFSKTNPTTTLSIQLSGVADTRAQLYSEYGKYTYLWNIFVKKYI